MKYDPFDDPDEPLELGDDASPPARLNWPFGLGGMLILVLVIGAGYLLFSNRADPAALAELETTPTLTTLQTATPDSIRVPNGDPSGLNDDNRAESVIIHRLTVERMRSLGGSTATAITWAGVPARPVLGTTHSISFRDGVRFWPEFAIEPLSMVTAMTTGPDGLIYAALDRTGIVVVNNAGEWIDLLTTPEFEPRNLTLLQFSPDGRWLVAASQLGAIWLFDREGEFRPRQLFSEQRIGANLPATILAVGFSPNSQTVVTIEYPALRCEFQIATLDANPNGICARLELPDELASEDVRLSEAVISADGLQLAILVKASLWVGPLGDFANQARELPRGPVSAMAFSPSGRYLAIGGEGMLFIFDLQSDSLPILYDIGIPLGIESLTFDTQEWQVGYVTAFGSAGVVTIGWGALVQPIPQAEGPISSMALVPDTDTYGLQVAVGHASGWAQLWRLDLADGIVESRAQFDGVINQIAYTADGDNIVVVTTPLTGPLNIERPTIETGIEGQAFRLFQVWVGPVTVAVHPQRPVVAIGDAEQVVLYRLDVFPADPTWTRNSPTRQLTFTGSGQNMLINVNNEFDYVDSETSLVLGRVRAPEAHGSLVLATDGTAVIQRGQEVIYRLDLLASRVTKWTTIPAGSGLALSSDEALVVTSSYDGNLMVLDAVTLEPYGVLTLINQTSISDMVVYALPNDRYVVLAGGLDGQVHEVVFSID